MFDLIIIGGGPAGISAGVYAGRKKLKTLLIAEMLGGQSAVSDNIENWIGVKKITGIELAEMLEEHIRAQEDVEIKTGGKVVSISAADGGRGWEVKTDKGGVYLAKALIAASGGRRRRLNVSGEEKFAGKGVSYCSTCDAPVFKNKIVAVIGGGNAGLEAVIDLVPYASKIYLISNKAALTGDAVNINEISQSGKTEIIMNARVAEILGDQFVSGLKYLDMSGDQSKELKVDGIFVEIGSIPNSELFKEFVNVNAEGEIITDCKTGKTSREGIFAAGDVTDRIYRQNNISAGDGIIAALSVHKYLKSGQIGYFKV